MLPANASAAVQHIITAISAGDYPTALSQCRASRCSASDILRTVQQYGRDLSAPPFADWEIAAVRPKVGEDMWSVRAPLWSESEGGRSDMELRLTVSIVNGEVAIELDDVRVA